MGATHQVIHHGSALSVSIHAPVWVRPAEETPERQTYSYPFQFTHPCGCDTRVPGTGRQKTGFNSRTRVGATCEDKQGKRKGPVSIHAPVWVRLGRPLPSGKPPKFQFTHPCGCDQKCRMILRGMTGFNSRTRVGATFMLTPPATPMPGFNSRTRVGATRRSAGAGLGENVSIHAPVWVRHGFIKINDDQTGFNSRTRVGATYTLHGSIGTYPSFNSRTRVGATQQDRLPDGPGPVSIHAPVWVRRPDEYGLSIKHATKVLRQPDARTRCGQA